MILLPLVCITELMVFIQKTFVLAVRFGVLELLTFNTELEIKLCALFIYFPTRAEFLHSTDSQESRNTCLVQGMELYGFVSIVQGDQNKELKSDNAF